MCSRSAIWASRRARSAVRRFHSSSANIRTDHYGGSIAGRIHFAVEAVTATAEAIGPQRVGLRLSPGAGIWDAIEEDVVELYGALLAALAPLGLAYIHLEATTDEQTLVDLREAWPGSLIVNPSLPMGPVPAGRKQADDWLDLGADLISFGRVYLANPDLVERLRADLPLDEADRRPTSREATRGISTTRRTATDRSGPSSRPDHPDGAQSSCGDCSSGSAGRARASRRWCARPSPTRRASERRNR